MCICRNEIPFEKFEQGELTGDNGYLKTSFFQKNTDFCSNEPGFPWKMKTRKIGYPFQKNSVEKSFPHGTDAFHPEQKKTSDYWEKTPNFAQFFTNYWNLLRFFLDKCRQTAKMSDKLQENPLERKTFDTLKRKKMVDQQYIQKWSVSL